MKSPLLLILCLIAMSCGNKSGSSSPHAVTQREELLGIGTRAECGRAKQIPGSNGVFQWIKATEGDLQQIIIDTKLKKISYQEATTNGLFQGESPYVYKPQTLFFKTKSKNLNLTFSIKPTGIIENDSLGKEYKVGILSYDDGSGFHIPFLCPVRDDGNSLI